jgi:hypothetical protein
VQVSNVKRSATITWLSGEGDPRYIYYDPATGLVTSGAVSPAVDEPTKLIWTDDMEQWDMLALQINVQKTVSPAAFPASWTTALLNVYGVGCDAAIPFLRVYPGLTPTQSPGPYLRLGTTGVYHQLTINNTQLLPANMHTAQTPDVSKGALMVPVFADAYQSWAKPWARFGYMLTLDPAGTAATSANTFVVDVWERYVRM